MEVSIRNLFIALFLVFLLGILFAVINGFYTQSQDQALPLITYGISLVSLLVGALIVILFQWKINTLQLKRMLKILPHDEKTVIKILLENNGALEQHRLVALSGFNKVKMSRVISVLEQREVLEKKHMGYTNLILLKV